MDEIIQKLDKILSRSPAPRFAVFDFDNTCIKNDIADAVMAYMCRNRLAKTGGRNHADGYHQKLFLRYYRLMDEGHNRRAYTLAAKTLAGLTPKQAADIARKTIAYEGRRITTQTLYGRKVMRGLRPNRAIIRLLRHLHNRKIPIWIVSASPEPLVKATAQYYKIPGKVIGLCNAMQGSIFSKKLIRPLSISSGKVACIKKYIHRTRRPVLAAGDSLGDLPMLEYAHIKIVVDRNNELSDIARKKKWFVIKTR